MADAPVAPSSPSKTRSLGQLGILGTLYAIAAYLVVAHLVPWGFAKLYPQTTLMSGFGMIAVVLLAAVAAIWLYRQLFPALPGLRSAIAIGVGNAIIGFLLVFIVGYLLDGLLGGLFTRMGGQDSRMYLGWAMLAAIAFVWIRYVLRNFNSPSFPKRMQKIEEGGWFHGGAYKKLQGQKIRRITMATLLLTALFGIYNYYIRPGMAPLSQNTVWSIPFVASYDLILFRAAALTVPVLLLLLAVWFSYRLVNYPQFAEFLINTEAELAKVTWTTRKRLVRDTGVVLLTVFILAVFLYFLDILWVIILRTLGVLHS